MRTALTLSQPDRRHAGASERVAWPELSRCTTRLRELLGEPLSEDRPASSEDWYAHLLWVQRRKCLLLTHAGTLFCVLAPNVRTAELRPLGAYVVSLIAAQLSAAGLPATVLGWA